MHTIIAFSESQDPGGVFVKMAGVPDQHVKVQGDGIWIPDFNRILGGIACIGSTGGEARVVSPSLRRMNPYYIQPVNMALFPGTNIVHNVSGNSAITLDINESLECENNSDPAAGEQQTVGVVLAPSALSPIQGEIFTVNATVTIALIAGQWSFGEIDFIDELPVGTYGVVGMSVVAATAVLARMVPVGLAYRPGGPAMNAQNDAGYEMFRNGNLGEWFKFDSVQPPGIEILSSAAAGSATYQIYLDLMRP